MVELNAAGFIALAYADDLAVIGFKKCELKRAIKLIEQWAKNNKIIINKKKSGVMIHGFKGRTSKLDKGEISGFPYKNEYKYLGIIIDKNLTLK